MAALILIMSAIGYTKTDTDGKYNKITIGLIVKEILILFAIH